MLALLLALGLGALAGLTAVPHCVAMCGAYAAFACTTARAGGATRPTLAFLAARTTAYGALGLLAGASGQALTNVLPPRWASIALSISLALGMVTLAWRLVRAAPSRAPTSGLVALRRQRPPTPANGMLERGVVAGLLGAVMALFPCGAIYAALLIAAGTSGPWTGMAVLVGFAAVSGVALGAASWIARAAVALDMPTRRALGAALVLGAIVLVLRPIELHGADGGTTCHHEDVP